MLVADFVARSPADSARAGFIRHLADNVCQRVVVIVAAVPSAGHIAVIHRDAQTVHAVVVAVIAGIRVVGVIAGVAEDVMVFRDAAERRIPGVVARIRFGHLLLAQQSHHQPLAHHDAVPALQPVADIDATRAVKFRKPIVRAVLRLAVLGRIEAELEHHVATQNGQVVQHIARCDVVPVCLVVTFRIDVVCLQQVIVGRRSGAVCLCQRRSDAAVQFASFVAARCGGIVCPQIIAHSVVVAIDATAFDVNFEVGERGDVIPLIGPCNVFTGCIIL